MVKGRAGKRDVQWGIDMQYIISKEEGKGDITEEEWVAFSDEFLALREKYGFVAAGGECRTNVLR